jgi:hypothetical protein
VVELEARLAGQSGASASATPSAAASSAGPPPGATDPAPPHVVLDKP